MGLFSMTTSVNLKCQSIHLHLVKAPVVTLYSYRGSHSQSTGVKKLEKPNMDITKHTQMCSFGKNHVQPGVLHSGPAVVFKTPQILLHNCPQTLLVNLAALPSQGCTIISTAAYIAVRQTQNVLTRLCQSFFVGIFSLICHSVCSASAVVCSSASFRSNDTSNQAFDPDTAGAHTHNLILCLTMAD